MILCRFASVILALLCAACAIPDPPHVQQTPPRAGRSADLRAEAVERGRVLTAQTCARCHATGRTGVSPLPEAPPFRELGNRYPLDNLEQAFAEGIVTAHPAMPRFVFRAGEIDDLIAYLESLKSDQ